MPSFRFFFGLCFVASLISRVSLSPPPPSPTSSPSSNPLSNPQPGSPSLNSSLSAPSSNLQPSQETTTTTTTTPRPEPHRNPGSPVSYLSDDEEPEEILDQADNDEEEPEPMSVEPTEEGKWIYYFSCITFLKFLLSEFIVPVGL